MGRRFKYGLRRIGVNQRAERCQRCATEVRIGAGQLWCEGKKGGFSRFYVYCDTCSDDLQEGQAVCRIGA